MSSRRGCCRRRGGSWCRFLGVYKEERGHPPYHPVMMTALLLYAYTQGVFSSRKIARACEERVDFIALGPMLRLIKAFTGRQTRELSADTGYCSEDNLRLLARHHVRGYVATGRLKHGSGALSSALGRTPGTRTHAMRQRLARAGHRSRYRMREQVVEPVIGQIKSAMDFAHFHLRGLWKTAREWSLVCAAHNLRKLARAVMPALSALPRPR